MAGSYGFLNEGQEAVVKDALGKELVEAGLAEAVSTEAPEESTEAPEDAAVKSSINLKGGKVKK